MYLLIDIGGTKTRLAISPDGTIIDQPKTIPTLQYFEEATTQISALIGELSLSSGLKAAAVGLPGPLDKNKATTVNAPNLPHWNNQPIKSLLEQELGIPVHLANDADLAGLGEATTGAGQGYDIVAYLTISTGVGGTRIVNKKIDASAQGFEPGHQIILSQNDKPLTLEDCVSGTSLKKRYRLPAEQITDAQVWDNTTKLLALGLNNVTVHWSPHCIILGGSVMKSIPLDKLRNHFRKTTTIFPQLPDLKLAALGDSAGLHGALAYLQTNYRRA